MLAERWCAVTDVDTLSDPSRTRSKCYGGAVRLGAPGAKEIHAR